MQSKGIAPLTSVHKHFAAMHLRDGFDDGQAKAVVGNAVVAWRVHAVEALEQAR